MEKFAIFGCYIVCERRDNAVFEKLCVSERRNKILCILENKRQSTCGELARTFNVSVDTIRRDIIYLMQNYPIDFKKGNRGGVLLLYDYRRNNRMYLSDQEEEFLYDFMQNISDAKKRQMKEIIIKFSKNPIKEEWGLL